MRISNGIRKLEDTTLNATRAIKPKAAKASRAVATHTARVLVFALLTPATIIECSIEGVRELAHNTTRIDLRDKRMAIRR